MYLIAFCYRHCLLLQLPLHLHLALAPHLHFYLHLHVAWVFREEGGEEVFFWEGLGIFGLSFHSLVTFALYLRFLHGYCCAN